MKHTKKPNNKAYIRRLDALLKHGLTDGGFCAVNSGQPAAWHLRNAKANGGYCASEVARMAHGQHPWGSPDRRFEPQERLMIDVNDTVIAAIYPDAKNLNAAAMRRLRAELLRPVILALHGWGCDRKAEDEFALRVAGCLGLIYYDAACEPSKTFERYVVKALSLLTGQKSIKSIGNRVVDVACLGSNPKKRLALVKRAVTALCICILESNENGIEDKTPKPKKGTK